MTGLASILNLTAVSAERYIHIIYPFTYVKYIKRKWVLSCILAIWIASAGLSMLKGVHFHWKTPNYEMLVFSTGFLMPLCLIVYCYANIYKAAQEQLRKSKGQTHCSRGQKYVLNDLKAVKTIAVVILGFFICWCPFFILNVYHGFCDCIIKAQIITFAKWMHYSNSAMNPIIYACYNKEFRKGFRNTLLRHKSSWKRGISKQFTLIKYNAATDVMKSIE